jgi:hypothetical protein
LQLERWSTTSECSETEYSEFFAPALLCAKRNLPQFDERARGSGYEDRALHALEMRTLGVRCAFLSASSD